MDETVKTCDADVVEDWEVDELLRWSTGLDFDDYWKDWQTIATSDLSEATVCTLVYSIHRATYDSCAIGHQYFVAVDLSVCQRVASSAPLSRVKNFIRHLIGDQA